MKSFATSSFGALTSLFLIFANLSSYTGSVQAAVLPLDGLSATNVPIDLVPEYLKLMNKCNADNALLAIQYNDGEVFSYKSDKCFQRKLKDKHPVEMAVFCKTMSCKVYRTNDCTGVETLPISVPLPGALTLIDPFDLGVLVGGSAICKKL